MNKILQMLFGVYKKFEYLHSKPFFSCVIELSEFQVIKLMFIFLQLLLVMHGLQASQFQEICSFLMRGYTSVIDPTSIQALGNWDFNWTTGCYVTFSSSHRIFQRSDTLNGSFQGTTWMKIRENLHPTTFDPQ